MEISLEKLINTCKTIGLSENVTIELINKLFGSNVQNNSKDIPMKVKNNYTWGNHDQRPDGNCPVCNYDQSGNASSPKYKRCPGCNQRLDWN
jgi:hypothetical protein